MGVFKSHGPKGWADFAARDSGMVLMAMDVGQEVRQGRRWMIGIPAEVKQALPVFNGAFQSWDMIAVLQYQQKLIMTSMMQCPTLSYARQAAGRN